MNGMHTLDLARVLSESHRSELANALRARPSPAGSLRSAIGERLVRIGSWMLGSPSEPQRTATTAVGC